MDKKAIQKLKEYTGLYRNLAFSQYHLSRQQDKSVIDSLVDAREKVFEVSNSIIERYEAGE